uniref:Putative secreted metalloprotease n=1 Tax=Ixodes ricinus TaxID=34613 RepID=A0A147BWL3_IXORI
MLAFFMLVAIFSASSESALSAGSSAGRFVYPRLLQARGTNGEKLLHIQDGLILNLEKTSVLAENFILTTFERGNQIDTLMNGKELEKNVYHDRNQAAAVSVEEKDGTIEVRGALSPKLRIAPSRLMARSEDGRIAHEILDIEQRGDFKSDYIVPPNVQVQERAMVFRRHDAQVPEKFTVEVAFLVDLFMYREFSSDDDVIPYLVMLLQLINLRYQDTSDPLIEFLLVQVFVGKTGDPVSLTMYENDVDKPSSKKLYMKSEETLSALARAVKIGTVKTTADIMVLITALDLADKHGSIVRNSVLGIAYLGAVCHLSLRAALAEDHAYTFATVGVTAHELAHALGSVHDGDVPVFATVGKQPKICDPRNGNTMAPTAGGANFGVFSECSLDQMSSFAGSLTEVCFKVASSKNYTIPEKPFHGKTWDHFKHKATNKTFYCQSLYPQFWRVTGRDHNDYSPRCKLLCCPAQHTSCFIHDMADGMGCGANKVCIRHVCATPGRHPTAPPRRTTTQSTTTTSTTPRNRPGRWSGRYRTRFPGRYLA